MTTTAHAFAAAAEASIGTPFRLHGRSIIGGLDCVGLVQHALQVAGREVQPTPAYGLRNADYSFVINYAALNGFEIGSLPIQRGDLIAIRPGPAQLHLLIATDVGAFVHAHAGLQKVVAMSDLPDSELLHHFRLLERV